MVAALSQCISFFRNDDSLTPMSRDSKSPCQKCQDNPQPNHLQDLSTGISYPYFSIERARDQAFVKAVIVPTAGAVIMLVSLITRVVAVVTLSHFWKNREVAVTEREKAYEMGEDILKIVAAPIALVGLELAAIYGIFRPYEGIKMFDKIQKWEDWILWEESPLGWLTQDHHSWRHLEEDLKLGDFYPWNEWEKDVESGMFGEGKCRSCTYEWKMIIDTTTGRHYFNDRQKGLREKGVMQSIVGVPVIHSIIMVHHVAYRILRTITLSRLWVAKEGEASYHLGGRVQDMGIDLLRIAAAPIALIGLELSAIYMIFNPLDGKKMHATIERAEYGQFVLTPCLQPGYTLHHFGPVYHSSNQP